MNSEGVNYKLDYEQLSKKELIQLLQQQEQKVNELTLKLATLEKKQDIKMSSFHSSEAVLNLDAIKRYSRQLILPEIGPRGQKRLIASSALIVGCGGLGCPAAVYLAGAGIGKLGLVDFDEIELSNLHRQILHNEKNVGTSKALSIIKAVNKLNSNVVCIPHILAASSKTIMDIIVNYDVILDCSDNVATRYLLNDACILSHKPLISGSALRFEGQLTVYGYQDGPCYRCLFPKPPPPDTVTNCSDGGVIGAVPGAIGCLQALEAIKILVQFGDVCFKKMILFDALSMTFRNIKLRGKQSHCEMCGDLPVIQTLVDYEQFCGTGAVDKVQNIELLCDSKRITVNEYKALRDNQIPHLLIDVRSSIELEICKLPNCINIPITEIEKDTKQIIEKFLNERLAQIICVCRRGNDSQKAVLTIKSKFPNINIPIVDMIGGLYAWSKQIDNTFPIY